MNDLDYKQEISDLKRRISRQQEIIEMQDRELDQQRKRVQQKNRDLSAAHNRINRVKEGVVDRSTGTYITTSHQRAMVALQTHGPITMIDLQSNCDFAVQTRLSELRRMGYVKSKKGGPRQQKIWSVVEELISIPDTGTFVEYGNLYTT